MKELMIYVACLIAFFTVFFVVLNFVTSAEFFYAGSHDAECELQHGKDTCECYSRLIIKE